MGDRFQTLKLERGGRKARVRGCQDSKSGEGATFIQAMVQYESRNVPSDLAVKVTHLLK